MAVKIIVSAMGTRADSDRSQGRAFDRFQIRVPDGLVANRAADTCIFAP